MKKFKTALITGAGKGLGKNITLALTKRCESLILVGRDVLALENFKKELAVSYQGRIEILGADLTRASDLEKVKALNSSVDLLINNAGIGCLNRFEKIREEQIQQMIALNMEALTILTQHFGKKMADQGGGQIINISSAASFLPVPYFNVYAASKAYVRSLSHSLDYEWKSKKVRVKVLCPGGIKTNFHVVAGMSEQIMKDNEKVTDSPETVAKAVLKLIDGDCTELTPGLPNQILKFLAWITTLKIQTKLAGESYLKYLP